jgi:hypothetical protein
LDTYCLLLLMQHKLQLSLGPCQSACSYRQLLYGFVPRSTI